MIVYRELSSLEKDLGVSAKTMYTLTNQIHHHYRKVQIPKGNGEFRELSVPDDFLKAVQRKIADNLLSREEISAYATAYRPGGSTQRNAKPHVGKSKVMKLDIRGFFDHCIYPVVKERAFPAEKYSEPNRILLTLLCVYKDALPQGAPTSPAISNILLRDFDNVVGQWCNQRNIAYTRYCDDMTFSGQFDHRQVKALVKTELKKLGFFLNDKKNVVLSSGQRQSVTGITVNEKPQTSADYRRKLRQELYYCQKFGIEDHIQKLGLDVPAHTYKAQLLGRVNYAMSVNPTDRELQRYKAWLMQEKPSIEDRMRRSILLEREGKLPAHTIPLPIKQSVLDELKKNSKSQKSK